MSCEHEIKLIVSPTDEACKFHIDVSAYKDRIVAPDEYSGATVVTPSDSEQVLATTDKLVRDDITINPAPTEVLSTDHNGTFTPSDGHVGFSSVIVNNPAQWTTEGIANGTEPYGDIDLGNITQVADYAFCKMNAFTGIVGRNVTTIGRNSFNGCQGLHSVLFPQVVSSGDLAFSECTNLEEIHMPRYANIKTNVFSYCGALKKLYLPKVNAINSYMCRGDTNLEELILPGLTNFGEYSSNCIQDCSKLKTIVFGADVLLKTRTNVFVSSQYSENGEGGDIYIPKKYYDHLGDGSNLDYLANSVWATVYGWGKLTFKQIEGSEYETYMPGGAKYEEEMALT